LDEEAKLQMKMQGRRLRRNVVGVAYGNPAHLLDATSYVKEAWQSVSPSSIKNAFIKAKIMTLEVDQEAVNEIEDLVTEVAQAIAALNLSIGQDELEEFVHVDDENSEKFATAVLEDVEELLKTMKIAEENLDDDNDDDILTSQTSGLGLGNTVVFTGFKSLYKQIVDIEDQLLCSEVREEAEETFDDLRKLFESFQSKVRVVTLKAKRNNLQNLRQMTIHDMLN
jgi:hydrogenase maturation factor HypE